MIARRFQNRRLCGVLLCSILLVGCAGQRVVDRGVYRHCERNGHDRAEAMTRALSVGAPRVRVYAFTRAELEAATGATLPPGYGRDFVLIEARQVDSKPGARLTALNIELWGTQKWTAHPSIHRGHVAALATGLKERPYLHQLPLDRSKRGKGSLNELLTMAAKGTLFVASMGLALPELQGARRMTDEEYFDFATQTNAFAAARHAVDLAAWEWEREQLGVAQLAEFLEQKCPANEQLAGTCTVDWLYPRTPLGEPRRVAISIQLEGIAGHDWWQFDYRTCLLSGVRGAELGRSGTLIERINSAVEGKPLSELRHVAYDRSEETLGYSWEQIQKALRRARLEARSI